MNMVKKVNGLAKPQITKLQTLLSVGGPDTSRLIARGMDKAHICRTKIKDDEPHITFMVKITTITTPLGVALMIGAFILGIIQTQFSTILFLILGIFVVFAGIFMLQPLQDRRSSTFIPEPLLWFENPEHIAINAQPSSLSLQDGRKKSLFVSLFDAVFDIFTLAFGLLMIVFGTALPVGTVRGIVAGESVFNPSYGPIGDVIISLIGFLVLSGIGVFLIIKFIDRKRVLTIDRTNNKVKFEYVRWPRYGTINYELRKPISFEIIKKKRKITHHEGGDDNTPSRTWTTTHHGVDVVFDLVIGGMIPLFFLEGKKPETKFKSILELLSSTFLVKGKEEE